MYKTIITLGCVFLFSRCATLYTGKKQWVQVITEPAGASLISNKDTFITPCIVKLKRTGTLPVLTIQHPYCKDTAIVLSRKWNETSAINCINPVFWAVDYLTGAYCKYKPLDTLILPIKKQYLIK